MSIGFFFVCLFFGPNKLQKLKKTSSSLFHLGENRFL